MPVSALALRNCGLFANAPDSILEHASRLMQIIHLKRREVLLIDGRPFRGLGVVLQGKIQAVDHTIDGREASLATIETDGVFGQANLMAERPVDMTWIALGPTTLAIMPPPSAMAMLGDAHMSLRMAKDLAQQVCDYVSWQKVLSVHPVSSRVCAWLVWSAAGNSVVSIPTHAELAWRLNTTRESITRTLQRLQADNVLRRESERWHIDDLSMLKELARGESTHQP